MERFDDRIMIGGQIHPESAEQMKALGVTMIVNNRPDGEEPGQPTSAEIEAAAEAEGIAYRHVPVAGGFSEEAIVAMKHALEEAEGPVLAFCRTGARSAFIWGLARARMGDEGATIIARAAAAGFDLRPIRHYLFGQASS